MPTHVSHARPPQPLRWVVPAISAACARDQFDSKHTAQPHPLLAAGRAHWAEEPAWMHCRRVCSKAARIAMPPIRPLSLAACAARDTRIFRLCRPSAAHCEDGRDSLAKLILATHRPFLSTPPAPRPHLLPWRPHHARCIRRYSIATRRISTQTGRECRRRFAPPPL